MKTWENILDATSKVENRYCTLYKLNQRSLFINYLKFIIKRMIWIYF